MSLQMVCMSHWESLTQLQTAWWVLPGPWWYNGRLVACKGSMHTAMEWEACQRHSSSAYRECRHSRSGSPSLLPGFDVISRVLFQNTNFGQNNSIKPFCQISSILIRQPLTPYSVFMSHHREYSYPSLDSVVSPLSNEPDQRHSLWEEGVGFQAMFFDAIDVAARSLFRTQTNENSLTVLKQKQESLKTRLKGAGWDAVRAFLYGLKPAEANWTKITSCMQKSHECNKDAKNFRILKFPNEIKNFRDESRKHTDINHPWESVGVAINRDTGYMSASKISDKSSNDDDDDLNKRLTAQHRRNEHFLMLFCHREIRATHPAAPARDGTSKSRWTLCVCKLNNGHYTMPRPQHELSDQGMLIKITSGGTPLARGSAYCVL